MDIQHSLEFSYAGLNSLNLQTTTKTWRAGSMSVHGFVISYAVVEGGIWYLMPLSTIFQWYHGGGNRSTGEIHQPTASDWHTLPHNGVSSTPRRIRVVNPITMRPPYAVWYNKTHNDHLFGNSKFIVPLDNFSPHLQ